MKKKNRTIERAENLITKRIDALGQKIESVKERYPYELYGLRYMSKQEQYEEEITELREYLESHMFARTELEQAKELKREMFNNQLLMKKVIETLHTYGENSLAAKLERNLEWLQEQMRNNG